jgi:Mn2+/Fe2+ NRAMP family transporter
MGKYANSTFLKVLLLIIAIFVTYLNIRLLFSLISN